MVGVQTKLFCNEIAWYLSPCQPVKAGCAIEHSMFILPLKLYTVK